MLLCIAVLITASGCSRNKATVIVAPIKTVPVCYDPQIADSEDLETIISNCFEGLVRIDEDGNIQKGVANLWTITPDELTYTFTLRSDAKWRVPSSAKTSLGEDFIKSLDLSVTANDFAFGITRALDSNTGAPYAYMLDAVKRAYAVDDKTLVIELKKPCEGLLTTLALPICMPCKEDFFLETAGRYGLSTSLLLSNGPYYLGLFDEDTGAVTLKKNETYAGNCRAAADTVRMFVETEDTKREFSIKSVTSDEALSPEKGYTVTKYKNSIKALCFNNARDVFITYRSIRLAFAHSTDIETFIKPGANRADGVIPSACLLQAGTAYRASANILRGPEFDLSKAGEIFNGLKERNEAQTIPDDIPLSFKLICMEEDLDNIKTVLQSWQKTFGVTFSMAIETFETQEDLNAAIKKGDYDIAYTTIVTSDFLAAEYLKNFTSESVRNPLKLSNTEFDKLVEKALDAEDSDNLTQLLVECESFLLDNAYIIPTVATDTYIAKNEAAEGITILPAGTVIGFYK